MNLPKFMRDTPARERDEGSHNRQKATEEDSPLPILGEPAIGHLQVVLGDEEVAPVSYDERPAAQGASPVGNDRTKGVPRGRGDRDYPQVEDPPVYHPPSHWHDDLTGKWDARALNSHGEQHTEVAYLRVQVLESGDDELLKGRKQANLLLRH